MSKKELQRQVSQWKIQNFFSMKYAMSKKVFFCIEIDSFGVYFDLTDVFRLVYFWKSFIWRVSFSIYDIHLVYYI